MSTQPETPHLKIRDHVIIVGYGLNGRNLVRVLHEVEIPYVVLDVEADLVRSATKDGVSMVYGDATNPTVLKQVRIEQARVLVIATSDPFGARRIVQQSRGLNSKLTYHGPYTIFERNGRTPKSGSQRSRARGIRNFRLKFLR